MRHEHLLEYVLYYRMTSLDKEKETCNFYDIRVVYIT